MILQHPDGQGRIDLAVGRLQMCLGACAPGTRRRKKGVEAIRKMAGEMEGLAPRFETGQVGMGPIEISPEGQSVADGVNTPGCVWRPRNVRRFP